MASCAVLVTSWSLIVLFVTLAEAREILFGGKQGAWRIPESSNQTLNHWAERTRFRVGDSLLFQYDAESDSVLQVTRSSYDHCIRSNPIRGFKDGNTRIHLDVSGPFYFISGERGNCRKGEKLVVVVLSPNHHRNVSSYGGAASPEPLPVTDAGRAPASRGRIWGMGVVGLMITFGFIGSGLFK